MNDDLRHIADLLEAIRDLDAWHSDERTRDRLDRRL